MSTALHGWLNIPVKITLNSAIPATLQGTLFYVDDAGILLERPHSKLFVPFASILHIEGCNAPDPEIPLPPDQVTLAEIQFWRPHL